MLQNASEVIEYIFTEIATAQQRNEIIEEFYGLEYSTFKVNMAVNISWLRWK